MSLYNDLTMVLTPYANKIKQNESDINDIQDALEHLDVDTDKTLSIEGKPADAKVVGDALKGISDPTDEQVNSAVERWLSVHPEATTMVEDASITMQKLASDVKSELSGAKYYLRDLSATNGDENRNKIQNALNTYRNVVIARGEYPVSPTIEIESACLDLNGSKIVSTAYKSYEPLFLLSGNHPVIKNGEVCAQYDKYDRDAGYAFFENESLICVKGRMYQDAIVDNIDAHNCWGYAISMYHFATDIPYSQYVSAPETSDYEEEIHRYTSAKMPILSGYKYLRVYGGIGYNRIISQLNIKYDFYDESDNLLETIKEAPGCLVRIPTGSSTYRCAVYLYTSDFRPYNVYYYNYKGGLTIRDCVIHNNHSLAIAGIDSPTYIYNTRSYQNGRPAADTYNHSFRATTGFLDIEDVITPYVMIDHCESRDENLFLALGGYEAIVSNCRADGGIGIYRGNKVAVTNCICGSVDCQGANETAVIVTNCIFTRSFGTRTRWVQESNCVYYDIPFGLGSAVDLDRRRDFTIIIKTTSMVSTTGIGEGKIVNGKIYALRNIVIPLNTARGSHLLYNNNLRDSYRNFYGAMISSYNVFGVSTNMPIFPNGHVIGDSIFDIDKTMTGDYRQDVNGICSGQLTDCTLNLAGAAMFRTSGGRAHASGGDGINVVFVRCHINNTDHPLYDMKLVPEDKITFIDCTVADMNKIDSNGENCQAEILVKATVYEAVSGGESA